MTQVHVAGPAYEPGLMELCRELYTENGVFEVNFDKVQDMVRCALHRAPSARFPIPGLIGVIGPPEKPEASICLRLSDSWYSDDWVLQDAFNYVHPDYRRTSHAKDLLSFAKKCADDMEVPLMVGVVSNIRTEAKVRLVERMMPKVGAVFLYRGDKPLVSEV